jgi:hypothetical protein
VAGAPALFQARLDDCRRPGGSFGHLPAPLLPRKIRKYDDLTSSKRSMFRWPASDTPIYRSDFTYGFLFGQKIYHLDKNTSLDFRDLLSETAAHGGHGSIVRLAERRFLQCTRQRARIGAARPSGRTGFWPILDLKDGSGASRQPFVVCAPAGPGWNWRKSGIAKPTCSPPGIETP